VGPVRRSVQGFGERYALDNDAVVGPGLHGRACFQDDRVHAVREVLSLEWGLARDRNAEAGLAGSLKSRKCLKAQLSIRTEIEHAESTGPRKSDCEFGVGTA
jgi:hypothetical protein